MIKFNSAMVVGTEVVVRPGTPLILRCEGDGPVNWLTRLAKHKRYVSKANGNVCTFNVEHPSAEFTGTYKCVYMAGPPRVSELASTVHVFIKGELEQINVVVCVGVIGGDQCIPLSAILGSHISVYLFKVFPFNFVIRFPEALLFQITISHNLSFPSFTRPKPHFLDQQYVPACGEEGRRRLPAPLPTDRPISHRPGASHGERHRSAPWNEHHRRPAQGHSHPQPPP